jgi:hypothetical protein
VASRHAGCLVTQGRTLHVLFVSQSPIVPGPLGLVGLRGTYPIFSYDASGSWHHGIVGPVTYSLVRSLAVLQL